jgi:hypothetical protein
MISTWQIIGIVALVVLVVVYMAMKKKGKI